MAVAVRVVIVSFNSSDQLGRCLEALECSRGAFLDVVVVDNASRDGSVGVARLHGVRTVELSENVGYAAAVGVGAAVPGTHEYLLVMNPDVTVGEQTVAELLREAEADERVGAVGPRLLGSDQREFANGRNFLTIRVGIGHVALRRIWRSNPFSRRYYGEVRGDGAASVDWLSGCCLLLRRRAFEEVGGLNSHYFLYFEDMEIGLRLKQFGWSRLYLPDTAIQHGLGASRRSLGWRSQWHHVRSAAIYICVGRRRALPAR